MDYITINGKSIPYPNGFSPKKTAKKANAVTTLSGKDIADIIGHKYETTTMKWDTLVDQDLSNLIQALSADTFSVTFADMEGTHTVNAVLESSLTVKSQFRNNGNIVWRDISVEISFPDCL